MIRQLTPPVSINDVEVIGFDTDILLLHAVVHIYTGENDYSTTSLNDSIMNSVKKIISYMETEGFLPTKKIWSIKTGILIHPSRKK